MSLLEHEGDHHEGRPWLEIERSWSNALDRVDRLLDALLTSVSTSSIEAPGSTVRTERSARRPRGSGRRAGCRKLAIPTTPAWRSASSEDRPADEGLDEPFARGPPA